MTTIGIIGAGHIGSQIARAAIANGYDVVISNSRGPETLSELVGDLGRSSRAEEGPMMRVCGCFGYPKPSSSVRAGAYSL